MFYTVVTRILCFNVALMVLFSFAATTMGDAAKSKPLVGFGGLVSALLATVRTSYLYSSTS
jgi:hypothetical protein